MFHDNAYYTVILDAGLSDQFLAVTKRLTTVLLNF